MYELVPALSRLTFIATPETHYYLHLIAAETSSEKSRNLHKVTQPVRRQARTRNPPPKSQKCPVRLGGLGAKEPQKCSHGWPRLRRLTGHGLADIPAEEM